MRNLGTRLAKLEEATMPKRIVIVTVDEAGVDPLPAYLAEHPEDAHCNLIVADTGIHRPMEA